MYVQVIKAYWELIRAESLKVSNNLILCIKTVFTGMSNYKIFLSHRIGRILQCWILTFMPNFQGMDTKAYVVGTKS